MSTLTQPIGTPKANKVPSNNVDLTNLFLNCASATAPDITSPRATHMVQTYRSMVNLKKVPKISCPMTANFEGAFFGCKAVTTTDPFVFAENMNYNSVFEESGVKQISFAGTFKNGSLYQWAFKNCKSLTGFSDPGLKDSFTVLGKSHRDCFCWADNFTFPLTYTATFRLWFPDSTDIAGFMRGTNALGSYNGLRGNFHLDAPHAVFANAFHWEMPAELRPLRYFDSLVVGMQRCKYADGFFGQIKVKTSIYMEYMCPPYIDGAADSSKENCLITTEVTPGVTGISFLRNTTASIGQDMYEKVSQGVINALIGCGENMWWKLRLENFTVSIATLSKIQNSTFSANASSPGIVECVSCTFEDPEGLYTLQTPAHPIKIVAARCTNAAIIQRALTNSHTIEIS